MIFISLARRFASVASFFAATSVFRCKLSVRGELACAAIIFDLPDPSAHQLRGFLGRPVVGAPVIAPFDAANPHAARLVWSFDLEQRPLGRVAVHGGALLLEP